MAALKHCTTRAQGFDLIRNGGLALIRIKCLTRLQTVEKQLFIFSHNSLTLFIGRFCASQTDETMFSLQEMLYSWQKIYCGSVLVCTAKYITSKLYSTHVCLRIPPEAVWLWPPSVSLTRNPPNILLLGCRSWERVFPQAASMIFHNMFVDIPWEHSSTDSAWKSVGEVVCVCMFVQDRLHRTWEEDHVPGPENQGGVSSYWLFLWPEFLKVLPPFTWYSSIPHYQLEGEEQ